VQKWAVLLQVCCHLIGTREKLGVHPQVHGKLGEELRGDEELIY